MVIVRAPGPAVMLMISACLGLIVTSYGGSEQCILPGKVGRIDTLFAMVECGKNFSSHNLLEGLEVESDDVISGSHGLFPTHQDAGQLGSTMEWFYKRFEFLNPVLGLPFALVEAPWRRMMSTSGSFQSVPGRWVTHTIFDDIHLALMSAGLTAKPRPFVAFYRWFNPVLMALAWLFIGVFLVAVLLHASLFGAQISLSWMALFWVSLPGVQGVTCYTCCDQISGCPGGDACPLLTTVTANAAAIVATGVATMSVDRLLPREWVRHLSSEVLRTLQAIARAPTGAAAPNITTLDLQGLMAAYQQGQFDIDSIRAEISARVADPATSTANVTRLNALSTSLKDAVPMTTGRMIPGAQTVGALTFVLAVASHIVKDAGMYYTFSEAGTSTQYDSKSDSRRGRSMAIKLVVDFREFSELLHVWQGLLHALGVSNVLSTTRFLQDVVHSSMGRLQLTWQQGYCMLLVYIEEIEKFPATLNIGNVYASGSQDTRLAEARLRATHLFKAKPKLEGPGPKDDGEEVVCQPVWNGKDTPSAEKCCFTFNLGKKGAKHPIKHLKPDGTCCFRHVCNAWVSGKGPGGICEGNHPRTQCTNPGRVSEPEK